MTNLTRIKSLRAQDYGVAGLSTTDVDWLIAEVERLKADRDRYKTWHDGVKAIEHWREGQYELEVMYRPQFLKENE